jgi:hypothetical protein
MAISCDNGIAKLVLRGEIRIKYSLRERKCVLYVALQFRLDWLHLIKEGE